MKEYLTDKFELVVTNHPLDGWVLVPDGAEYFVKGHGSEALFFYKHDGEYMAWKMPQGKNWIPSSHTSPTTAFIILWQRENKVESKGRFLHQEWLQKFIDGQDIEFHHNTDSQWRELQLNFHTLDLFNVEGHNFRIKPQTIQIGSRTINKPISVKPEKGTDIYTTNITAEGKYSCFTWLDCKSDHALLARNICHLTAADAIVMADALLELMK